VREICMLRSTRRGLETWHGRDGVTLADERARQRGTQTSTYTGASVLDPTGERGWETERCLTAQATAPILDSTVGDLDVRDLVVIGAKADVTPSLRRRSTTRLGLKTKGA
jgi:hypothetical protein